MRTFVEFIQERDNTKTYLSTDFTVLALYSEYVAWLARLPVEQNEAAVQFTTSQLLMQLEIINKYQIHLLYLLTLSNNLNKPIALSKVPDYMAGPNAEKEALLPGLLRDFKNALPQRIVTRITDEVFETMPLGQYNPSALKVVKYLFLLTLAICAIAFTLLEHVALPFAAQVLLQPIAYTALFSAAGNLSNLTGAPMIRDSSKYSPVVALALTLMGVAQLTLAVIYSLPFFGWLAFGILVLAGPMLVGMAKAKILDSVIKKTEPLNIIDTLDKLDKPELDTSLNNQKRPIVEHLHAKNQPDNNGLEEAVSATTHCFLASRYSPPRLEGELDNSLSIQELDYTLRARAGRLE